jgi:hypothetical protein
MTFSSPTQARWCRCQTTLMDCGIDIAGCRNDVERSAASRFLVARSAASCNRRRLAEPPDQRNNMALCADASSSSDRDTANQLALVTRA